MSKSLLVIEKDLKKTVKDIQPKKLQAAFTKMVEAIESKKLIQDEPDEDDEELRQRQPTASRQVQPSRQQVEQKDHQIR